MLNVIAKAQSASLHPCTIATSHAYKHPLGALLRFCLHIDSKLALCGGSSGGSTHHTQWVVEELTTRDFNA